VLMVSLIFIKEIKIKIVPLCLFLLFFLVILRSLISYRMALKFFTEAETDL